MTSAQRLTFFAALATLLGLASMWGLYATGAWLGPTVSTVLIVAVMAHAVRSSPLPRVLAPIAAALAAAAFLHTYFAHASATFGILPTRESVTVISELFREAFVDIERFAAPITPGTGVVLLTAAGVGGVALLVDTLAVTLRRASLAGLPLLALYSVPAGSSPDGVGWTSFAIGAGGYLALLLAESRERVGRWGRTLSGNRAGRADASPLAAVGRRVGVAAVALAVAVPAVLPGIGDGIVALGGSGGFGTGNGKSTVSVDNPVLDLRDDLNKRDFSPVLRYTTTAKTPGYLRLVVLDTFSGTEWSPSQLRVPKDQTTDKGLGVPPGLTDGIERQTFQTEIKVERRFDSRWLPVPYIAQRVAVDDGRWLYDRKSWNIYSSDTTTRDRSYTVDGIRLEPTAAELRDAPAAPESMNAYLALPPEMPESVGLAAQAVTNGARTSYDKALALQNWLRDGTFLYSANAPSGSGPDAISEFLERKSGFCVHFASAMAIMARQLGIPARVAIGYLPGDAEPDEDGLRTVTDRDAHAWPELYFETVGWVQFEPTPPDRTGGELPLYAQPDLGGEDEGSTPGQVPVTEPTTGTSGNNKLDQLGRAEEERGTGTPSEALVPVAAAGSVSPRWALGGLALLVALALPSAARALVRRRRWHRAQTAGGGVAVAEAAWAELADSAWDHGFVGQGQDTPRQYVERLGRVAHLPGDAAAALARLARLVERARWSPAVAADAAATARADVASVVAALREQASGPARWRARLAPPSTVALLHRGGELIADGLDWLDAGAARLWQRLVPRRRSA